jgi:hypothetical protein
MHTQNLISSLPTSILEPRPHQTWIFLNIYIYINQTYSSALIFSRVHLLKTWLELGVSKKTDKPIKPRKPEKK